MITQKHTQESLSLAYVHAVSGLAGINNLVGRQFDYGVDGSFREVIARGNRRVESGIMLDYQLKCTTRWDIRGDKIVYDLESKTYNDLVTRKEQEIGLVLLLLCVPKEAHKWATYTEEATELRRCCYHTFLHGSPVENEHSTKRIEIPRQNILTPNSLIALMQAERKRFGV